MSDLNFLHLVAMEQHVARTVRTGQPTGHRMFASDAPTTPTRTRIPRQRGTKGHPVRHLAFRLSHRRLGRA